MDFWRRLRKSNRSGNAAARQANPDAPAQSREGVSVTEDNMDPVAPPDPAEGDAAVASQHGSEASSRNTSTRLAQSASTPTTDGQNDEGAVGMSLDLGTSVDLESSLQPNYPPLIAVNKDGWNEPPSNLTDTPVEVRVTPPAQSVTGQIFAPDLISAAQGDTKATFPDKTKDSPLEAKFVPPITKYPRKKKSGAITPPLTNYGTFRPPKGKNKKRRSKRGDLDEITVIRQPRGDSSDAESSILSAAPSYHPFGFSISLTREDVDHLCDDASERVRCRPDLNHWLQVIGATLLLCPFCGFVAFIYACKSKRQIDEGHKEQATRMLRRSDFCLRLATIFGTLLWFGCLLTFAAYRLYIV